ncbi:hypothetical protein INR49_001178 [Caranx melampygus]|nr:hypothetical protein INR49_001178 [Caranx melampygus]
MPGGLGSQDGLFFLCLYGVYLSDTGVYWCESERGQRSNILNITVSSGSVILESPTLPVEEGDNVMLRCSHRGRYDLQSKSDFNAAFYRDGVFIGYHSEGKMTLQSVSKKDEGSYKCQHPTAGASPQSLLVVTVRPQTTVAPTPAPPFMSLPRLLCTVLLIVIYVLITILCIHLYRRWARARANAKRRDAVHLVAAR